MEKKLKQVSEGQGFICATINEKKRIWQRLTDAGYEMYGDGNEDYFSNIYWACNNKFVECAKSCITDPLNESDFFDEWTPQAGEWVEVSDGSGWYRRQFFCTIHKLHLTASGEYSHDQTSNFTEWQHIRQIKPETMTLQEVREALGKPNLIIE